MANTIASKVYREKYASSRLDYALRKMLVAEDVCMVDRSDAKTIENPFITTDGTTVQAIAGTYTPGDVDTTNDTLTVTDEFIEAGHIFDFENVLTRVDLFNSAIDEMINNVATEIDKFVLNNLCEDGTGAYATPSGGFGTSANTNIIFSEINGKVAGFADAYKGLYVVVENTDVPGIIQAQAGAGFMFRDAALRNGLVGNHMGVDIYVVRTGTFVDATIGTKTVTNDAHRVAGVKGVATYAAPRGIRYEEKAVSGKTGKEVVVFGYIGFKQWAQKADLTIDITLTA